MLEWNLIVKDGGVGTLRAGVWRRIGAHGQRAAEPRPGERGGPPALVAEGCVPPNAALEQSTLLLTLLGKPDNHILSHKSYNTFGSLTYHSLQHMVWHQGKN